jgi:hypothetical protein
LLDNGIERERVLLESPEIGLILHRGVWRDIIWHEDNSVLCVAASEYYNESDYVRNYDEYIKLVREGFWSET